MNRLTTRSIIAAAACLGLGAASADAAVVFSENFEGASPLANFAVAQQVTVASADTPFGAAGNSYADINDISGTGNGILITPSVLPAADGLYTAAFSFNETSAGGADFIRAGFNGGQGNFNSGSRISFFDLDDGLLMYGGGTFNYNYALDTEIDVLHFINTTDADATLGGMALPANSASVYARVAGDGGYTFVGNVANINPTLDALRYGFQSFAAQQQELLVDDLQVFNTLEGSLVPEPTSLLTALIAVPALLARRSRRGS